MQKCERGMANFNKLMMQDKDDEASPFRGSIERLQVNVKTQYETQGKIKSKKKRGKFSRNHLSVSTVKNITEMERNLFPKPILKGCKPLAKNVQNPPSTTDYVEEKPMKSNYQSDDMPLWYKSSQGVHPDHVKSFGIVLVNKKSLSKRGTGERNVKDKKNKDTQRKLVSDKSIENGDERAEVNKGEVKRRGKRCYKRKCTGCLTLGLQRGSNEIQNVKHGSAKSSKAPKNDVVPSYPSASYTSQQGHEKGSNTVSKPSGDPNEIDHAKEVCPPITRTGGPCISKHEKIVSFRKLLSLSSIEKCGRDKGKECHKRTGKEVKMSGPNGRKGNHIVEHDFAKACLRTGKNEVLPFQSLENCGQQKQPGKQQDKQSSTCSKTSVDTGNMDNAKDIGSPNCNTEGQTINCKGGIAAPEKISSEKSIVEDGGKSGVTGGGKFGRNRSEKRSGKGEVDAEDREGKSDIPFAQHDIPRSSPCSVRKDILQPNHLENYKPQGRSGEQKGKHPKLPSKTSPLVHNNKKTSIWCKIELSKLVHIPFVNEYLCEKGWTLPERSDSRQAKPSSIYPNDEEEPLPTDERPCRHNKPKKYPYI